MTEHYPDIPDGNHFILDDNHNPVPAGWLTWARWFEDIHNRRVAFTRIDGDCYVSTVFIGLPLFPSHFTPGPPLLFETMAFYTTPETGTDEWDQDRYATWDEAVAGHQAMVDKIMGLVHVEKEP